jgi:hypothetical protein
LLSQLVLRLTVKQGLQDGAGLLLFIGDCVELGQVQVGLIEIGSDLYTPLEFFFGSGVLALADQKDAEVVPGVGVIGTGGCSFL